MVGDLDEARRKEARRRRRRHEAHRHHAARHRRRGRRCRASARRGRDRRLRHPARPCRFPDRAGGLGGDLARSARAPSTTSRCAAACSKCAAATTIAIATREAVAGDDLHRLETEVLARFRQQLAEEQAARTDAQRLYLAAIRQICRFLRPERAPAMPGGPVVADADGIDAMTAGSRSTPNALDEAVRTRRERRERWQREGERSIGQNLAMIGALGWTIVIADPDRHLRRPLARPAASTPGSSGRSACWSPGWRSAARWPGKDACPRMTDDCALLADLLACRGAGVGRLRLRPCLFRAAATHRRRSVAGRRLARCRSALTARPARWRGRRAGRWRRGSARCRCWRLSSASWSRARSSLRRARGGAG